MYLFFKTYIYNRQEVLGKTCVPDGWGFSTFIHDN